MKMPRLGMGTWGIGGRTAADDSHREEEVEALRCGLGIGYRLIDTAEYYGNGMSERVVGDAIEEFNRSELFIVSKVWRDHLRYDEVLRAAEGSLNRLGTDYIDLYLIHWPNPEIDIKETLRAMTTLVNRKIVRTIGVSNFDVVDLQDALAKSELPITANQIEYSVSVQNAAEELIPFCQTHNIDIMAYRPLSRGALSSPKLAEIASRHGSTPAQVALAWLLEQNICAIPKATNRDHLYENWEAQNIHLSDKELEVLKSSSM